MYCNDPKFLDRQFLDHNIGKFLNFWEASKFAVIYLKFKKRGQTFGYFMEKMQME